MKTIEYMYNKVKRNIKNILFEDVRRFFSKGNIFKIKHNGITTLFYLPDSRDSLQQSIIVENRFRECVMLDQISSLLNKDSVVLDIGANIGNHTLYFSNISKVKKVYSFEPQEYIFKVLKKNIEINDLSDKVVPFNVGVGEKEDIKKLYVPKRRFLRAGYALAAIIEEKDNINNIKLIDTKIITIDNQNIKEKIDLIKIDTEGSEVNVLKGARKTIDRDKPIVFVETLPKNIDFVKEYFNELGYNKPILMRRLPAADDLLFIHSDSAINID